MIKPDRRNLKLLKRELKEILMNQGQQVPQSAQANGAPPAPIVLTPFDDFTNVTTFLKNLVGSIRIPDHVTAPRTKQLFDDLTKFVTERLESEVAAKY